MKIWYWLTSLFRRKKKKVPPAPVAPARVRIVDEGASLPYPRKPRGGASSNSTSGAETSPTYSSSYSTPDDNSTLGSFFGGDPSYSSDHSPSSNDDQIFSGFGGGSSDGGGSGGSWD